MITQVAGYGEAGASDPALPVQLSRSSGADAQGGGAQAGPPTPLVAEHHEVELADADFPEYWARIRRLDADARSEAVAALSAATVDRFDDWLSTWMRCRGGQG